MAAYLREASSAAVGSIASAPVVPGIIATAGCRPGPAGSYKNPTNASSRISDRATPGPPQQRRTTTAVAISPPVSAVKVSSSRVLGVANVGGATSSLANRIDQIGPAGSADP